MTSRKNLVFVVLALSFTFSVLAQQSSVTAGANTSTSGKLDVDVVTGDSGTSMFRIFNSSNAGLFSVNAAGDVVVGGATSSLYGTGDRFYVYENADTNSGITIDNPNGGSAAVGFLRAQSDVATMNFAAHGSGRTLSRFDLPSLAGWAEILQWRGNGLVMGTTLPASVILGTNNKKRFEVLGTTTVNGTSRRIARFWDDTAFAAGVGAGIDLLGKYNNAGTYVEFANIKGVKANATDGDANGNLVVSVNSASAGAPVEVARFAPGSMAVTGDANFTGTVTGGLIKAHYQDVAEWVPSREDLAPGTVVILDTVRYNGIVASSTPYDTKVAGVVSAQPGIVLGEEGAAKEQIATTGRVRVKVDASNGAIAVGDLLVTSGKPGFAMRSTPVKVSGISMHRPGTIVGKALEPLSGGEGEILVLLSLQ